MREKELIGKIRELRRIQPSPDWVVLTKKNILGEELTYRGRVSVSSFLEAFRFNRFKLIFAPVLAVLVLIGVFGFAQNSLPGDHLYPLKRIVEKSQAVFVSEEEQPKFNLELANKRLEDLTKIAETNQVKKLAPALQEYQASVSAAAKKIAKVAATTSDPLVIKEIAVETQKFEENKDRLEKAYGIAGLEVEEESNPTKPVVEWLIKDLENRRLSEEDQSLFEKAKEDFNNGNYSEALIKILSLSQR